ncbi:MAG: nuclear transport factor 2 family protein [Bacteroidota bacterium]
MKNILLFLLLLNTLHLQAQQSDLQQIEQTLNNYLIGGTENDAERLVSAFHPNAMMKFIRDGEYQEVNAAQFFLDRIKPGPPADRSTEVATIDLTGHVAVARLNIHYEKVRLVDYVTLMKINEQWKIINKTFYREVLEN